MLPGGTSLPVLIVLQRCAELPIGLPQELTATTQTEPAVKPLVVETVALVPLPTTVTPEPVALQI